MLATALTNQCSSQNDLDIERMLEDFDGYILRLVGRKVHRIVVRGEMLDMEVDEIVQNTRIKLWQALQRRANRTYYFCPKLGLLSSTCSSIARYFCRISLP
jgi:DNA-directed RNA polymerase specialized sigma24 family protein